MTPRPRTSTLLTQRLLYSSDRITLSGGAMFLVGSVVHGLCLGPDGKMHATNIDLNDHYSNRNASFVSANNHFYSTSDRNLTLNVKNGAAMLRCKLLDYNKKYRDAEVDISICIVNRSGQFAFVEQYVDFSCGRDPAAAYTMPIVTAPSAGMGFSPGFSSACPSSALLSRACSLRPETMCVFWFCGLGIAC
jgi:hypothetical protein